MLESLFSWGSLWVIMWALYLPACIGLIVIVLLQKGKGSGFAGAFGVGPGSETVFGPRARKSLPVKMTYAMAVIFMVLALSMSLVAGRVHRGAAPEAVAVDEEVSAESIYDQLLGGMAESEMPVSTPEAGLPDTTDESADAAGLEAEVVTTPDAGQSTTQPEMPAEAPAAEAEPAPESAPAPAGDSTSAN